MNADMIRAADEARKVLLRQASATLSVNRMVGVSGERIRLPLEGRDIEIVYYRAASENAPILIGYHSGGWLFGGCALNDSMWTAMRDSLDINIASVGYRKAPKHKWKDSLDDAYESAMYLHDHSSSFGFDREHISMFGPSAGGNLAAATCIRALREHRMMFEDLILLYPLLDVSTEPSLKGPEHFGGPAAYIMNEQHISPSESKDPLASPVFAGTDDLTGFPYTLVITAEHDALKHEGRRFADNLKAAGSQAAVHEYPGMSHCFFELGFRDKLTDFEAGFIGPKGVMAFDSGDTRTAAVTTLEMIKKELKHDKC